MRYHSSPLDNQIIWSYWAKKKRKKEYSLIFVIQLINYINKKSVNPHSVPGIILGARI